MSEQQNAVVENKNPMEEFKDKISSKIREDIAGLIPEDVIKQLIERAVEEQFFKPRIENDPYNHYNKKEKPSWFVELVVKHSEEYIKEEIKRYAEENKEVIKMAMHSFLQENNLLLIAMQILREQSRSDMETLMINIINHMNNNRSGGASGY